MNGESDSRTPEKRSLRVNVITLFGEVQEAGDIETGSGAKGRGVIFSDGKRQVFILGLSERETKELAENLYQPVEIDFVVTR